MTDNIKAALFLLSFAMILPVMYLAPTILNALTDIAIH